MIDLVHADQPGRQLEHVVSEGDDDELGVLGPLLNVVGDDGDLCVVTLASSEIARFEQWLDLRF